MDTVRIENMATVWATSGHLMVPRGWWTVLNNAPRHRKNRVMTIPMLNIELSRQMVDERVIWYTIGHRADENSGESSLLLIVQ